MRIVHQFLQCLARLRYPVSMPREVAEDLGFELTSQLSYKKFFEMLIDPASRPKKLSRWMPRDIAEGVFQYAKRKERFIHNSLFSYYFKDGWIEFILQFDDEARLRRLYLRHKRLKEKHEITLA